MRAVCSKSLRQGAIISCCSAPGRGKVDAGAPPARPLPPLSAAEALETSMIYSIEGSLKNKGMSREPPFATPITPLPWPQLSAGTWRTPRSGEPCP
ncbi:ATP-binding protein [Paracoccus cavernae]|uniref:ATP-binding protein n=1 Tax=Paracoccus cavernae TaxID=1571207 RepID=A0ABT8D655_9RHOB|nr:ATP-binding protein [Paracoccus cavernae]